MKNKTMKIIVITMLSLFVAVLLFVGIFLIVIKSSSDYVQFDTNKLTNVNSQLKIIDAVGNELNEPYYIGNYKHASIDKISKDTINCFLSIEDKRFYTHRGIDYHRILGATIHNIKAMQLKEGASTISQQLIKNTHLSNNKTLKRKINEMLLTKDLESKYNKNEILEMYLNTIYFGANAYGIETASNIYFDKSVEKLNLSESAVLAGMIKAPNNYSPFINIAKCKERRNTVLSAMLDNGKITQKVFDETVSLPICVKENNKAKINEKTYTYAVMSEASSILNISKLQLINSDMQIETYFDETTQNNLIKAIENDNVKNKVGQNTNKCGIVTDNKTCGIIAFYAQSNSDIYEQKRQIGSTAKPFTVYAPAFDLHLATPATPVLDEITDFNGYYPHNYNDKYEGWTTINNAVTHSLNVPAVKTLNMIGIDGSKKYLNKMAIDNAKDNNLSLALGNFSNGMTIKKLNECYMCLANYGEYSNSSAIKKITYKGKIIYIHANERTKVFETSSAFLMTSILQNTPLSGTAKAIGKTSYDLAVKTGTVGNSNGNTDAYLCGYTPKNTFTFWMGGENMNNSITGGKLAESFGKKFLINNYSKKYKEKFYVPSNVRLLGIDKIELCQNQLIMLAGADINENETEYFYFDINNAPKEFSKRKILNNYDNIKVNSISSSNISLTLPKVEQNQTIKLHKKRLNIEEEFVVVNTEYCDYNVKSGENYFYYYTIEVFGKEIFRSVEIQVSIPDSENSKDDNQNLDNKDKNWFTDFWYIR